MYSKKKKRASQQNRWFSVTFFSIESKRAPCTVKTDDESENHSIWILNAGSNFSTIPANGHRFLILKRSDLWSHLKLCLAKNLVKLFCLHAWICIYREKFNGALLLESADSAKSCSSIEWCRYCVYSLAIKGTYVLSQHGKCRISCSLTWPVTCMPTL